MARSDPSDRPSSHRHTRSNHTMRTSASAPYLPIVRKTAHSSSNAQSSTTSSSSRRSNVGSGSTTGLLTALSSRFRSSRSARQLFQKTTYLHVFLLPALLLLIIEMFPPMPHMATQSSPSMRLSPHTSTSTSSNSGGPISLSQQLHAVASSFNRQSEAAVAAAPPPPPLVHTARSRSSSRRRRSSSSSAMMMTDNGHNQAADPFPTTTRPGTSIVAVCMNRHDTLRRTLPTWRRVRNVSEIVIVDWSSSPPLYSSVIEPVLLSSSSAAAASSSSFDKTSQPLNAAHVRVVRVDDENTWVLTRAYNLAMSAASYDTVIRTDCDYALSSDFITAHPIPSAEAIAASGNESLFYAGNYASARDANEAHLNGAVVIRRKDFFAIGGYDERIQTYGWDDEDLYGRLQQESNLTKRNVSFDHVGHVRHADAARAGAQRDVEFVQVEIDLNSLLLKPLGRWNASHWLDAIRQWTLQAPSQVNTHHTSSSYSKSSNSNSFSSHTDNNVLQLPPDYVAVSAEYTGLRPKPLKALVSQHDYDEAWKLALGQRLANDFQMPWDIMETMPADSRKLLLARLNARLSRRRTAALEHYKKQSVNPNNNNSTALAAVVAAVPPPRLMFVHCMHGLGNRLRALASAMSFANATDRELVVIWEKDAHIAAYFDDLFVAGDSLVVMSHFKPKWPFAGYDKWDRAWTNFRFYNYMEMEGNGAVKGAKIIDEPDKHIYFKSAYIMHVSATSLASLHPRYHQLPEHLQAKEKEDQTSASSKRTTTSTTTTNWDRDNTMLRSLTPVPGVVSAVRSHAAKGLQHMVGIHIRDRTLSRDIRNVDFGSEYGPSASTEMQYWREKSSYRNFIAEMWRMVERDPDLKFYIATDTVALFETLNREFPDRLVYTPRACDGRDGACIQYALIDLLCLAKTKELVGSNWSSFTEAASRFGGKKPRLSGVDFAKELPHAQVQQQQPQVQT